MPSGPRRGHGSQPVTPQPPAARARASRGAGSPSAAGRSGSGELAAEGSAPLAPLAEPELSEAAAAAAELAGQAFSIAARAHDLLARTSTSGGLAGGLRRSTSIPRPASAAAAPAPAAQLQRQGSRIPRPWLNQ